MMTGAQGKVRQALWRRLTARSRAATTSSSVVDVDPRKGLTSGDVVTMYSFLEAASVFGYPAVARMRGSTIA